MALETPNRPMSQSNVGMWTELSNDCSAFKLLDGENAQANGEEEEVEDEPHDTLGLNIQLQVGFRNGLLSSKGVSATTPLMRRIRCGSVVGYDASVGTHSGHFSQSYLTCVLFPREKNPSQQCGIVVDPVSR